MRKQVKNALHESLIKCIRIDVDKIHVHANKKHATIVDVYYIREVLLGLLDTCDAIIEDYD